MSLAPLMSSKAQDWRTPKDLFERIQRLGPEFFSLDAAADADNHLCVEWLGPGGLHEDALSVSWHRPGMNNRVWLNPPYGRALALFSAKAVEQVTRHEGLQVWMLVPARVDTRWWNLLMTRAVSVHFMAGRVKFEREDGARDAAPFPTAVIQLCWLGGKPSVVWGWRA